MPAGTLCVAGFQFLELLRRDDRLCLLMCLLADFSDLHAFFPGR
jgi:hypothetical protein